MPLRRLAEWVVSRASRDTTSGLFLAEIDGLRFIAIMSVVLFHIAGYLEHMTGKHTPPEGMVKLLYQGAFGVQLFFVISGAVIALPFAKAHLDGNRPPRLRQYFTRRLTRLEPPYLINMVLVYLLLRLFGHHATNLSPHLLASAAYLHNVLYGTMSTINSVAWSLEIELQFYLLAPLFCRVFTLGSKVWRRALLVALIATFSALNQLMTNSPRYELALPGHIQFFFTGFLLIDVYLSDWKQQPRPTAAWDLVSLLCWPLMLALLVQGGAARAFAVIPLFLAYCAAFKGTWSNRFFCTPAIYTIGGMCYTIYLYHCQIITGFGRVLLDHDAVRNAPFGVVMLAASGLLLPLVLFFSTLLFIWIEKPCMRKNWHKDLLEQVRVAIPYKEREAVAQQPEDAGGK
ncbi:acyltransferase family protein [Geomonas propionica]|uniref:Acyltransferase n=1 Tax=Geomonas propionica TaxID=2798582 RepID=A0ABS0YVF5_9BACT|nr:acyltransferase [Geomonas propionica]MBJ6801945.1 acyltransferase [Geomonas propionica]